MATYGYRRVSSDGQEDGTSLDTQAAKIKGLAMVAELEEPIIITDVCTGSIPLSRRTHGGPMVAALKRGDNLIVTKLDRAFRSAADALQMADELKAKGITLYLLDMGTEPVTNNGASKMFFGMLALVAEFERTRIRERLADGREAKKSKGGHIGGKRPFGFDVIGTGKEAKLVEREDEQQAIARMRRLKARGKSLRAIAADLTAKGFPVSHMAVSKILARTESGGRTRSAA